MQEATVDYYQENYEFATDMEHIHPGYQFTIQKIRATPHRYLSPSQRRVIDVGCGPGYLLVDLQRRGFDCLGIDFNPDAVRLANERFGVPARVERVENLIKTGGAHFDLALLSHVLEHVESPLSLLKDIYQLLDPAGVLVIDVPNRDWFSPSHSLKRGTCFEGDYPPNHLTFWSSSVLSCALNLAGYTVLECAPRPFNDLNRIETFVGKHLKRSEKKYFTSMRIRQCETK